MPASPAPSDAMTAKGAWAWLIANPGHGVRTGRIECYMPAPGIVEVGVRGTGESRDLGHAEFLNDFAVATFWPLDTSDIA